MEQRWYITAFSDAILSITSIWSILMTQKRGLPVLLDVNWPRKFQFTSSSTGFLLLAVASFLGFIRFSILLPHQHNLVVRAHTYFSFLASATGLPMLAAAYSLKTNYLEIHTAFAILAIVGPIISCLGILKQEIVRESASTLSIVSILVFSTLLSHGNLNVNGIIGSVLFAIAGLAIGTDGHVFWRLRNIDLFHFVLACGTIFLGAGI